ncbi:MAG: YggT family protein [Actinomycetota bacterium]
MVVGFLCLLVRLYVYVLFARVILSFVVMFRPTWTPPTALRPVLDLIYGITDPPVNALRRVIPQPYGLPIDLAFLVLFLIVGALRSIICSARLF